MSESRLSKELHRKVFELTLALYRVTDFFPQGEVLRRQLREKANEIFGRISEYDYTRHREEELIQILARIESMRGYISLARSLRFVKPINLTVLEREYNFLATLFSREFEVEKPESAEAVKDTIKDIKKNKDISIISEELPTWDEFSQKDGENARAQSTKTHEQEKALPVVPRQIIKEEIKSDFLPISDAISERQKAILDHLKQKNQAKVSDFYSSFGDISSKTIQRDLQDLVSKNIIKKDGEKRWTTYSL